MSSKPGCPFNHFGPCLQDKCKFYTPSPSSECDCAIVGAHTHALLAHADTSMMLVAVNFMREMIGLPLEAQEEHSQFYHLQIFSSDLKRFSQSLSAYPDVADRVHVCSEKLNRVIDILVEDNQDEE